MEDLDSAEVGFYLSRAQEAGGVVLELGCGTGIVTVALALAGIRIEAYEPSSVLLQQALERRHAHELGPERCRIERADLRSLRLGRRFEFVFAPETALLALGSFDDLLAVFATARAHLAPTGRFAFNVRQQPVPIGEDPESHPGVELRALQSRRPHLRTRSENGRPGVVHRLQLLGPDREQIAAALEANRLQALEQWSDFDGRPYGALSDRLVAVVSPIPTFHSADLESAPKGDGSG